MKHLANPLGFFGKFSFVTGLAGLISFVAALFFLINNSNSAGQLNLLITMTVLLWATAFQFMCFGLIGKLVVDSGSRDINKADIYK